MFLALIFVSCVGGGEIFPISLSRAINCYTSYITIWSQLSSFSSSFFLLFLKKWNMKTLFISHVILDVSVQRKALCFKCSLVLLTRWCCSSCMHCHAFCELCLEWDLLLAAFSIKECNGSLHLRLVRIN